ncbi:DUF2341 domain-containing protein [Candidatus Nomurabacteria bacterium]|nr:DUF2341 domain-containing protein [Candidatus Nomurabacteria bacterium]
MYVLRFTVKQLANRKLFRGGVAVLLILAQVSVVGLSYPRTASAVNWNSTDWPYRVVLTINPTRVNADSASTTIYAGAGSGTFVVPTGVTSVTVHAWGGGGGAGGSYAGTGGAGGGAGYMEATLSVTSGESLGYIVGGGGGGGAREAVSVLAGYGGGGGGHTEVTRSGDVLVIAAGGGGGGGSYTESYAGGGGGGSTGVAGTNNGGITTGGTGGSQSAGGTGGTNGGTNGASESGGAGGAKTAASCATNSSGGGGTGGSNGGGAGGSITGSASYCGAGGGGGSGYYGGGGGGAGAYFGVSGAGGGGGSSYATSTASATSTAAGSGVTAGGSGNTYYTGGAGQGGAGVSAGAGNAGNPGLLVFEYDLPSAAQTDFPVYVDLSDLPASFWSYARSDCGDIRIVASDGSTELPREVVACDNASQTGELWFKAPQVYSSQPTRFYIYYGYASGTDYTESETYGAENVWTNNYVAVYHLNETVNNTAGGYKDSTANGNDGTGSSMALSRVSGALGGGYAQEFDGTNDYITAPASITAENSVTLSAWAQPQTTAAFEAIISSRDAGLSGMLLSGLNSTRLAYAWDASTAEYYYNDAALTLDIDEWNYTAVAVAPTETNLYVNNNQSTHSEAASARSITDWEIAYETGAANRKWDGYLDEVRVASVTRSPEWIQTEYNNQFSPSTFYFISSGSDTSLSRRMRLFEGYTVKLYTSSSKVLTDITQSFTSVGTTTWTVPDGVTSVDVLLVGGGGGGGGSEANVNGDSGGGGGAGEYIYQTSYSVTPSANLTVVVGDGGAGQASGQGAIGTGTGGTGDRSVFDSLVAVGGGGGGANDANGGNGGSGGGAGGECSSGALSGGTATAATGSGNDGGDDSSNDCAQRGGSGGGGAGSVGSDSTNYSGAGGGTGIANSITGSSVYYAAGGGGGGGGVNAGGSGGSGVGGNGGGVSNTVSATDGQDGTGSGGGGAGAGTLPAGDGGSGVVVLSFEQPVPRPTIILYPNN